MAIDAGIKMMKEEHITCTQCKNVMMIVHICYGKHMESSRHVLDGKDLCHFCWDKHLEEAVLKAGY